MTFLNFLVKMTFLNFLVKMTFDLFELFGKNDLWPFWTFWSKRCGFKKAPPDGGTHPSRGGAGAGHTPQPTPHWPLDPAKKKKKLWSPPFPLDLWTSCVSHILLDFGYGAWLTVYIGHTLSDLIDNWHLTFGYYPSFDWQVTLDLWILPSLWLTYPADLLTSRDFRLTFGLLISLHTTWDCLLKDSSGWGLLCMPCLWPLYRLLCSV